MQPLTYARFYTEEESTELCSFLQKHNIPYLIEKDREVLDKIYVGDTLDPMINLKISSKDFSKVNELILTDFEIDINQVAKDYYLFTFSDQELEQVLQGGNEWNYFDRALANKLLTEKNIFVTDTAQKTDALLFKPYHLSTGWLLAQYLMAIVFGYVGILIGAATLTAYKTMANGQKQKMYDAEAREHGWIILIIGVVRTAGFWLWVML